MAPGGVKRKLSYSSRKRDQADSSSSSSDPDSPSTSQHPPPPPPHPPSRRRGARGGQANLLLANFKKYFYPFQKMVIDESLMLFKGRLSFKQYIPSKRHRFGVKLFVLCDCETGFILDTIVYSATDYDVPQAGPRDYMGLSGNVVKKLMQPYLGRGHILYTDNWYTSPYLSRYLHENQTGSCGTVKQNRKFMPKFTPASSIILPRASESDTPDTDNEEVNRAHQRKVLRQQRHPKTINRKKCDNLLALKWDDRREVCLLSTIHEGKMLDSGNTHYKTKKIIQKPDVVLDYTQNMRLVDKADCMLSGTECVRRSTRWYQKLFLHYIDLTMINSYIAWQCSKFDPTVRRLKLREFVYNVAYQLLEEYAQVSNITGRRGRGPPQAPETRSAQDYLSRHHLDYTPTIPNKPTQHSRIRCVVCARKNPPVQTRVTTMCEDCNVGLCVGDCFLQYHSTIH